MLLPWGTDAPIYHWPIATVGLIVANSAAFAMFSGLEPESQDVWMLSFGNGIHPFEWVTHLFCHADLGHLIGNMIFLWAFGIVVEGKLGWWRFLLVYLGIGSLHGALEQIVFLGAHPTFALGASAAIFGLLSLCMVWAPRNDLNCISFFRFMPVPWDVPILMFALFYIGMEIFWAFGSMGGAFSSVMHSVGAVIGFTVGVGMLKAGLVDCENWDLFTVLKGQHIQPISGPRKGAKFAPSPSVKAKKKKKAKKEASGSEGLENPADAAIRRLRMGLEAKDLDGSMAAYDRALRTVPNWSPPEPDFRDYVKLLISHKQWRPAIDVIETYLKRADNPGPAIRVTLAQILAYEVERPAHALRVLSGISQGTLPPNLQAQYKRVIQKAEAMREEGVLELDGDSW